MPRIKLKRVYHRWDKWEDFTCGFYNSCSGIIKDELKIYVKHLFSNELLTREYMKRVVEEWIFSCEHNLTNESLNKIAYLGQAACCLYKNIPATVTMETWSELSKEIRDRSDKIAQEILNYWILNNKHLLIYA